MAEVRFTNFARTTIADATLSAAATSVTLTSVTGMPALTASNWTYFVLTRLSDNGTEIVKCTALDTSTKIATITRAQGGTTAKAFTLGDRIENFIVADSLDDLRSQWQAEIQASITNTITRGSVVVGGVSNVPTELVGKTAGQILIGNGTDIVGLAAGGSGKLLIGNGTTLTSQSVTGDLAITSGGAATVANHLKMATQWHADDTNFSRKANLAYTDDLVLEDSEASWVKRKLAASRLIEMIPYGYKYKLRVDITNDETLTATCEWLELRKLADSVDRILLGSADVNLAMDITASGLNGLDTGSVAASTMYYIYAIHKPAVYGADGHTLTTPGATAGLLSLSSTAPTLPAGYTYQRRIGEVATDASSDMVYCVRRGDDVDFVAPSADCVVYTSLTAAWAAYALPTSVPPGCTRLRLMLSAAASSHLQQGVTGGVNVIDALEADVPVSGTYGRATHYIDLPHCGAATITAQRYDGGSWPDQRCFVTGYELEV